MNYTRTYAARPCATCGGMIAAPKGPRRYCDDCKSACSVEGCGAAVRAKGLCVTHLTPKFAVTALEPINGRCGVEGCGRALKQKGMCTLHYGRAYRYGAVGDAAPRAGAKVGVPCSVRGCDKPATGRTYCATHYARWRTNGDAGTVQRRRLAQGEGTYTADGYHKTVVNGRQVFTHRYVMEQKLGRPLRKGENVHHLDGDRANNDPSNLELWVTQQPSGQRAADKVAAAINLLREHPEALAAHGVRLITLESQESTDLLVSEYFAGEVIVRGIMGMGV